MRFDVVLNVHLTPMMLWVVLLELISPFALQSTHEAINREARIFICFAVIQVT